MTYILEMRNITKKFPGVIANDNVNLAIKKGEIHALVGENGAGKSTLMSILYGLYQPDSGEILLNGQKVTIDSPTTAIKLGIGMVHQHFMLVPTLTVTENIVLGSEPKKGIMLNMERAIREVEEISKQYNLLVDPQAKIQDISVGMQQRVEIIKALYRGAEILVLDEPTAVLTPQEVRELFRIMKNLTAQGKTIIFITHKLNEVIEITDNVTVLRAGRTVGSIATAQTNQNELARMMVGREVILKVPKTEAKVGQTILRVENLEALNDRKLPALKGISFELKKGEVLGIAGVAGNGQTELIEVITGLRKATNGKVFFKEQEITNQSPRAVKDAGISHIPEDRHKRGLELDYTIADNLILGYQHRAPFSAWYGINEKAVQAHAENLIPAFDVRPRLPQAMARSLSGGNQQKVIIAREFYQNPELLIAAQPTRGVDIGAIEFIHKRIIEARDNGAAVLLVSAELQEILALSDRIAVMFEGEIMDILDAKDASEEKLGLLMAGVKEGLQ